MLPPRTVRLTLFSSLCSSLSDSVTPLLADQYALELQDPSPKDFEPFFINANDASVRLCFLFLLLFGSC
jgi:hypothetical protein